MEPNQIFLSLFSNTYSQIKIPFPHLYTKIYSQIGRYSARKKASSCSVMAPRNGWFGEICAHMEEIKKLNNYWTKEKCKEEAKKYNARTEFLKNGGGTYSIAHKNG